MDRDDKAMLCFIGLCGLFFVLFAVIWQMGDTAREKEITRRMQLTNQISHSESRK